MGITGNLKTMQLGELLQWLSLGSKTGTLLIDGHGVEKRVYFQDGRIASTSSSDQREYLGHFLVSHGFITEEELKMAMEVQEESQILLGKILVMINAIAESDLLRLMKKKAEESIYDIFLWTEGDFEFVEGQMPDQKMVPLSLDVTGIIMEGMRRYDEWQMIRQRVPDSSVVPGDHAAPRHGGPLRPREAHRSVHRRPALDRGDRAADAQRRVHRLQAHLRGPADEHDAPAREPPAGGSRRRRSAPGVSEVDHFLQRGRAQLKDDPAGAPTGCSRSPTSSTRPTAGRPSRCARPSARSRPRSSATASSGEKVPELAVADAEPDAAPVLARTRASSCRASTASGTSNPS